MSLKFEMDRVYFLDSKQMLEWDEFVLKHPSGWITHLSLWKEFLESTFPHIKGYYLATGGKSDGWIKSGLTIFSIRSWLTGNRLVSSPFATVNDPLVIDTSNQRKLVDAVIDLHRQLKSGFIEIKTKGSTILEEDKRLGRSNNYLLPVLRLQPNPENLLKSFHKTSIRQKISKASRCGVVVETVSDKVDLQKFYNLYVKTRRHLQLPPHPYRMFENMWNIFYPPGYLSLLLAKYREKVIAGLILFKFKSQVSGEYEAWDREYKHFCPVHLLIWEAIRQACEQNYRLFDFGRTSRYNLSLLEFKRRWGTDQAELTYFYFPAHFSMKKGQSETSMKYKLVKTVSGILPPTLLPAFGNFCYRHLG